MIWNNNTVCSFLFLTGVNKITLAQVIWLLLSSTELPQHKYEYRIFGIQLFDLNGKFELFQVIIFFCFSRIVRNRRRIGSFDEELWNR